MRKLYFPVILFCLLLFNERIVAQCAVNISTLPNTSQINCNQASITLTANAAGVETYTWNTGATTASITVSDSGLYFVTIKDIAGCTSSASIIITKDSTPPTVTALAFPDTICVGYTSTLIGLGAAAYLWQPDARKGAFILVSPAATTTYMVTGTGANGCTAADTIQIVVHPASTASISGTTTICQNASPPPVTFTGSDGMQPYTFGYKVNGGPVQTITSSKTSNSVNVDAPTGALGIFNYHLESVTDSNGCTQSLPQTINETVTITVLPGPLLTSPKTAGACNKVLFTYTAASSVTGTNFSWRRLAVNGIENLAVSGTDSIITETLKNITAQPVKVNYIFALSSGTGCITTDTVKVTVNPTPMITPLSDTTFCNGTFASGGIPFVSNISGAIFAWKTSNANIGLPASGTGNILPFIASNATDKPVTATITVSIKTDPGSCVDKDTSFTITVLPAPLLTSVKTTSVCNNTPLAYTARSADKLTTFSWTRPAVAGIKNPAVTVPLTDSSITETLEDTTSQPKIVKYYFTLSTGSGCKTIDSVLVTVNPTPVINPVKDVTYCNGKLADGIAFITNASNATFTWKSSNPNIGLPASGTGNILPFIASNATDKPITTTVTVSIKTGADNCAGKDTFFNITVLPAPLLTSVKTASICNKGAFSYTATSSDKLTTFSWTRPAVAGIKNPSVTLTDSMINETLEDTTFQPKIVKYYFTLSTGSGCKTIDSVLVTVNPTTVINPVNPVTYCNGNLAGGIVFTTNAPGAAFTWTNSNTDIGLPASGNGNILAFIARNPTGSAITAIVTAATIAGANGSCITADTTTFNITVLPAPLFTSVKTASICNKGAFSYTATSSDKLTTFSWTRPAVAGIKNPSVTLTDSMINETLEDTTFQPKIVKYYFTLAANSGCKTIDSVLVTVNPTPVIIAVKDTTICNGVSVSGISFSSPTNNASYKWNCDTSIGFGLSGSGNIPAFTANNPGNTPLKANVKVTVSVGNNCAGDTVPFTITVLPAPLLMSIRDTNICNNAFFTDTARSSASRTGFSWTRPAVAGIKNPAVTLTDSIINERLENTSSLPVAVKYYFTLSTAVGCGITRDSVKVTVNPTPVIDSIPNYAFCNDSVVQAIEFKSNASITWTCDTSIGFGLSGSGRIPAFLANNNSNNAVVATVTVKPAIGNRCQGNPVNFTITVYPIPALTSAKTASVCSDSSFRYTATSSAGLTRFYWTRPPVAGITPNRAGSGNTAAVSDLLHNTTAQPILVKYFFTLSTGIGCANTDSVMVMVNPTPKIDSIPNFTFCNGDYVPGIGFSSRSPNAAFTWTCDTTVGFGRSGRDSIPRFTATNLGNTPLVAHDTVKIAASANQCAGAAFVFTITVNPSPPKANFTSMSRYSDADTLYLCSGADNINFNVNSPVQGINYRWLTPAGSSMVSIRDTNDANTVVSFHSAGTTAIQLRVTNALGGCPNTVSQIVQVSNQPTGIDKRKIFLMQPGNLLIYPNNSLTSYQWGYDSVLHTKPDTAFGPPTPVQGQVYQYFIPGTKFIKGQGNSLNDTSYVYWVLLKNGGCYTRVYYNGPYAFAAIINNASDTAVQLQIIPNPNSGTFDVALKGNMYGSVDAAIYNTMGQIVFRKNFVKLTPDIHEQLHTNGLPPGLYFIVLNSSDLKRVSSRFIIQH